MGRPKLSDLFCNYCHINFKKKSSFDEHMESHSYPEKQGRQSRTRSNWCHVCRKSFDDVEYKLHIQTEHQFDSPKHNIGGSEDNLFSYESGYVLLSKRRIKKEIVFSKNDASVNGTEDNHFDVSLADIKVEPLEKVTEIPDYEAIIKLPLKNNILKTKPQKIKCTFCGMKCKGERGLKIHMSAHKRSLKNSTDVSRNEDGSKENEGKRLNATPKPSEINSSLNSDANALVLSNNGVINSGQNTQSGFVLNIPQLQNQSLSNILSIGNQPNNVFNFGNQLNGVLNVGNQPNLQLLPVAPTLNAKTLEEIPKFDCNSEKYVKWLKKFVYRCKMHKYPLPPALCQNISRVSEEITNALANPVGPLKKKSNHFYFIRMYDILSEIMLGHMRHSLCVVVR